uniref:protein-tyrosine-phosphatase n=1 Tax=Knipowitschia caucasica TaxID=637954 RepID=A0AAV2LZI1_KNICA
MEQAWILRTLLEELGTEEAEDQEAPDGIAAQFAKLRSQSIKYRTDKRYSTKAAEKSDNFKKNRYKDILPFDHSRVKLTFTTSKNDTDYINASFIKGVSGSRAYIATQGPLPHTTLDFLRMLWEYDIKVVVMACREFEMGKKKCECYWPKEQDEPYTCEPFTIYCDSEENKGDYVTRMLRVNYRNCSRSLVQLHYVNWPDHGVPDSIPPILDMLQEMRLYQDHDNTPLCIHCSAGCGRTGVLCVIDYTWNLLKKQMITSDFNIYDLVQNMRTQRPSVVQTKEQYELVYRTIRLLFQRFLDSEDSREPGSEVDTDEAVLAELGSKGYDMNQHDMDTELQNLLLTSDHSPETVHRNTTKTNHLWQYPVDLQSTSPQELNPHTPEERTEEDSEAIVHLLSSPAAVVSMVEDPYFDDPAEEASPTLGSASGTPSISLNDQPLQVFSFTDSGTLDIHSDDEIPPPLPDRTPESFEIPNNTEPGMRLAVVIPPNAAAAAIRELRGSPTSPTPPLPDRTPESFELATDLAPAEEKEATPAVNLKPLGLSSEWSGSSGADHHKTESFVRDKSLRANMTVSASPPSPVPPLPDRTPESFEFVTDPAPEEERVKQTPPVNLDLLGVSSEWSGSSGADPETKTFVRSKSLRAKMTFSEFSPPKKSSNTNSKFSRTQPLELPPPPPPPVQELKSHGPQAEHMAQPTHRVGMSSEWNGATQTKKFLDAVWNRSRSVRVKGSSRESQSIPRPQTAPPAAEASLTTAHTNPEEGHSVNVATVGAEVSEKGITRSKSLKFFRSKNKTKVETSRSQPSTPPPSYESLVSRFKFGFGNRFAKPKGPRSYPETWV